MNLQLEHTQVLLSLLEPTNQNIQVMIINSAEYIFDIRRIMPKAEITAVIKDEAAVDSTIQHHLWLLRDLVRNQQI